MTPGVCTWCGCAAVPAPGWFSVRCRSCRRWLLGSAMPEGSSGPPVLVFVPFRVEATADSLRLVTRTSRWRAWVSLLVLPVYLVMSVAPHHTMWVQWFWLGAPLLLGMTWLVDRSRVTVDRGGISLRGGWRRGRHVPRERVRSVEVEDVPNVPRGSHRASIVVARLDDGTRVDVAASPARESADAVARHVCRLLGFDPTDIDVPVAAVFT